MCSYLKSLLYLLLSLRLWTRSEFDHDMLYRHCLHWCLSSHTKHLLFNNYFKFICVADGNANWCIPLCWNPDHLSSTNYYIYYINYKNWISYTKSLSIVQYFLILLFMHCWEPLMCNISLLHFPFQLKLGRFFTSL